MRVKNGLVKAEDTKTTLTLDCGIVITVTNHENAGQETITVKEGTHKLFEKTTNPPPRKSGPYKHARCSGCGEPIGYDEIGYIGDSPDPYCENCMKVERRG